MIEAVPGLLHALSLTFQSLLLGGTVFATANPGRPQGRRLTAFAGGALLLVDAGALSLQVLQLMEALDLGLAEAIGADFVRTHVAFMATVTVAAALTLWRRVPAWVSATAALGAIAVSVSGGHAASRLDSHNLALAADFLHQAAAGIWLGGIPFLLLALSSSDGGQRIQVCRRFSIMAMASVAVLIGSAALLASLYVGSWEQLVGTDFGAMLGIKAALLAGLLMLGLGNLRAGSRLDKDAPLARLRSFATAEMAIGFAVLVVAAALASLPPPATIDEQAMPARELVARLWPNGMPRLQASVPAVSGSGEDRAWAEMTHHWAGLVVLSMGGLALVRRGWTRHWPLLFLIMGIGIPLSDPESWPMGQHGFWGKPGDWEVIAHRFAALLVVCFGMMEWAVQTDRLRRPAAALAFPFSCLLGGLLLLTHSHPNASAQSALPIHISHMGIGVLALAVAAGRWIELTGDAFSRRVAARIWPAAFALVGVLLILYRES